MSTGPDFVREPPLAEAHRRAVADLDRKATPAEVAWLHAHPLLRLRALVLLVVPIYTGGNYMPTSVHVFIISTTVVEAPGPDPERPGFWNLDSNISATGRAAL